MKKKKKNQGIHETLAHFFQWGKEEPFNQEDP